ncbi:MAG: peptidoglycan DD-metalloendopeptidase family protein [Gammaproteobacteria bacterium]|nr:peptidoglycan DD-metalloendopeptidase family protein [Gammaproteobacteria bacterium]
MSKKLTEVLDQIKNMQSLLHRNQSEQAGLEKELQKTEMAISHVSLQLHNTASDLQKKTSAINQLNLQQQILDSRIKKQQQLLLLQIRSMYVLGLNKNKLQLILQEDDPEKINRLLTYNRYLYLQNETTMRALRTNLLALKVNHEELTTHVQHLADLKKNQLLTQHDLDSHRHKQQSVLKNLSLQVKSHTDQLNELLKNKKNLENVVERLQKKESYSSDYLTHHSGRFAWPTSGKILEKFGSYIQNSELKQNGVLISAPEGQKVYSVAPGRIIFANWMPGYGLLLIIDHGRGYMTLYGNNGVLYKKTGDIVEKRELIATVGHTGGQAKSALYFALRLKGKPIDPCSWCLS